MYIGIFCLIKERARDLSIFLLYEKYTQIHALFSLLPYIIIIDKFVFVCVRERANKNSQ